MTTDKKTIPVEEVKRLFYIVISIFVISFLMQMCSNSGDKKRNKILEEKAIVTDSILQVLIKSSVTKTDLEIEGLKTEKRILLNTNKIFLTKERPDGRYLEIDKEIELKNNDKRNE